MNRNLMIPLRLLSRSRPVFHHGLRVRPLQFDSATARFGTVRSPNPRNCQQMRHTHIVQARYCSKRTEVKEAATVEEPINYEATDQSHVRTKAPTEWEKKVLVWCGKYPTVEDVPPYVSSTTVNTAMSKFRVYMNIFLVFATFFTALSMMYFGRRRAAQGESVAQNNMKRHPQQYEQHQSNGKGGGK